MIEQRLFMLSSIYLNLMTSSILKKHAFFLNLNSINFHAYSTITLILQVILVKNTQKAVAVSITFCPFIEITNCSDQLNIKALRHGKNSILIKNISYLKNKLFKINSL